MIEEQKLVTQVLAGDPSAEETFYKTFYPRLYKSALYFLGGHHADAEDMAQDTFVIALPRLKDYDFGAPIFAWLKQICVRLCFARMRGRNRMLASQPEDIEVFMRQMSVDKIEKQDREIEKSDRLKVISDLKEKLNPYHRAMIELRDVQGMSYAEISKVLDTPVGTVMSRLARSRGELRRMLENYEGRLAAREGQSYQKAMAEAYDMEGAETAAA